MSHPPASPPTAGAAAAPADVPPGRGVPLHMRRDRFDPATELARLHAEGPVVRIELAFGAAPVPVWFVTRYREAREMLGDSSRFSNVTDPFWDRVAERAGMLRTTTSTQAGSLLAMDPPTHTRLRRMLTGQFTVKRMSALRPFVEDIVNAQLDEMRRTHAGGGPVDLVRTFALPIPSLVICELLGVPYTDRDGFQRLSYVQLDMARPYEERMAAITDSLRYMGQLVAAARRAPGENLLGLLVREHGDAINDEELIGLAALLLLAGHETTANMLALGTVLLLRHPDQLAAVRDGTVPVEDAVEELLRHLTIVHTTLLRVALTDTTLGGQRIRAGDGVMCSLPLADRDADLGDDLDTFDVRRPPTTHVAFGHGIHHCLGAPLARMEMQLAFPMLLRAFPGLRLAVPFEDLEFRAATFVHGVGAVPVTW